MPLNHYQITTLENAIKNYSYPPIYSFGVGTPIEVINVENTTTLEGIISKLLRSDCVKDVKNGLASVIYWGNNTAGYASHRTITFNENVTEPQIQSFMALVREGIPQLVEIKKIGMPQFSGISFISKILAFLDPDKHCVLDLKLSRSLSVVNGRSLNGVRFTTTIGVTKNNSSIYYAWTKECIYINTSYYNGRYRAVDIVGD